MCIFLFKQKRSYEVRSSDWSSDVCSSDLVGRHLSLFFHRFLSGEIKGHARISLTVNGRPITAFDPFCRKNPATQVLPEEIVRIGEAEVRLQPYETGRAACQKRGCQ